MKNDRRIVMTLDAGGTNFVFTAIRQGVELVDPITLPAVADNLDRCLQTLVEGFRRVRQQLPEPPVAISFAFPGPADYEAGIIGDLPNFPAFRGGVPLGPFLQSQFGVPVFINNDGNLFAYGEAMMGILPEVNQRLASMGSPKRFKNLLGITLGTGFGAGVVINGELLTGDNGCGGDVWCLRNKRYPQYIVEEGVSIRAVKRVYREKSGDSTSLTPKEICEIADGLRSGNQLAAQAAFAELGEVAGDALASAITLVDGLIVMGGGVSGAYRYIIPALLREMRAQLGTFAGDRFSRLQMEIYDLEKAEEFVRFAQSTKRVGIALCHQGTNRAIAMGAYMYALNHLPE
ncbi:ROK family protein [Parabacteroides distasonis]|nr:ROK family protein [Parabacteroides distasonis]